MHANKCMHKLSSSSHCPLAQTLPRRSTPSQLLYRSSHKRRTFAAAPDTVAPRADANANDNMNAGRVGSMSPDVLAMFNEAQKNIMELNRSRLKALEELKEAKQRISDLEAQLDQARSKQGYAQRQVDEAQQRLRESWGQPEEEPQPVAVAQPEIIEEPAMAAAAPEPTAAPTPPQEPPASEPSAPTKGITIVYETGWDNAFVHYNADDKGWTKVPGIKMEPGKGKWNEKMVLHLDANRVEFVATNGHDWDSPQPQNEGDRPNYWADGHGVWLLKRGKLRKVE